ncbi:tripartite tricarboxylate transporter TctB family protein [Paracoccus sp. 1_MG-2023]|uniref:tripartite tricarboxylate transporter TctB family protein n=1 Tax=unclassified Paracoccus (in: a-proteobacteria) TaxID=2688777 RepID=UPI001C07F9CB|nr:MULTISPECIES: tripartite tricarboxylate transporter TctB family protein [unclassified Paracoccus (in: a-proteobacteria)]MBU2957736.1 tripartite tricarboxylate transporter TctB family protein [Paracoccus sp. C2R09]MDO6667416.1 tripartite tricarboxylate transporter TctB family protein [Paracoccus sp. 1_MG-2023]
MKLTDALSGAALILLGLFMLWQSAQFPSFAGTAYGAAMLPRLLALGFVIGGALLVLRDIMARRHAGGPFVIFAPELRRVQGIAAMAAVLGNVAAQILLGPQLGYPLVSVLGLLVLFLVLRLPVWQATLLAIGATALCWWLFAVLLRVPLPRGLLEGII